MKSTAAVCAIGALLVSFGTATFAQGFERDADDQQRFEQRYQRRHADRAQWDETARGDRRWHRESPDRRGERREQLLVVQEQEQRYEQPAYGPLTVVVQMPPPPAVAVVDTTERTIVRSQATRPVAKVSRPVAKRAVVAKAAACTAPAGRS